MGWKEHFLLEPDLHACRRTAVQALGQDARKDITTSMLRLQGGCRARIIAKSPFTLCGIVEAGAVFSSRKVRVKWHYGEGAAIAQGKTVATLSGNCRAILACERTALNFLMLLSGIATKSRAASEKYGKWRVAATRKTIPLLNESCKRAVLIGGCLPHRRDLSNGILVKDNHIAAIMGVKRTGKQQAIRLAVQSFPAGSFVEAEVSSQSEALAAVRAGAAAILIDNASPAKFATIAKAARKANPKIVIEASGGITLANAGRYLSAGADFVSTSELTMKIEPASLSLEIQQPAPIF